MNNLFGNNTEKVKYTYRFIAFIDILGFKDLVKRKDINDILCLLKTFQEVGLRYYKDIINKNDPIKNNTQNTGDKQLNYVTNDRQVSIFSDLIVISYSNNRRNIGHTVFELIRDVSSLQSSLLFHGVLIRGGITYDRLYHKNQICFGDGLIRAYDLETKTAIYPRIIVDPEILKFKPIKTLFDHKLFDLKFFKDGLLGVSHFHGFFELFDKNLINDSYYDESNEPTAKYNVHYLLLQYKKIIVEGIKESFRLSKSDKQNGDKLLLKYKWLAEEYKTTINIITNKNSFDHSDLEKLELI